MATCADQIHVGDVGTAFRITLYDCNTIVDVSTAVSQELTFLKPDGTKITVNTSFLTDGTDGVIQYLTEINDLDQDGTWKLQAHIVLPTGEWYTDIESFKVYQNL